MGTHMNPRSHVSSTLFSGGVLACVLLGGCQRALNNADQLYGIEPLPALEGTPTATVVDPDAEARAGTRIAPLDRSNEPLVVVRIQQAQVEHEPTYLSSRPLIASSARADRAWPTPGSALAIETDTSQAALDGLLEPLRPLAALLISPVSLVIDPPWSVSLGPSDQGPLLPPERHPAPWRWVQPIPEQRDHDTE